MLCVRISSAKFSTDAIEVSQRVGLDRILPMAAVLPFERHVRWAQAAKVSKKVALDLMGAVEVLASALGAVSGVVGLLMADRELLRQV